MVRPDFFTRRRFVVSGAVGAAALAARGECLGLGPVDFDWDARPGDHIIMTRAADDRGNRQPASIPWNAQGYGYNVPVPHPVKVS